MRSNRKTAAAVRLAAMAAGVMVMAAACTEVNVDPDPHHDPYEPPRYSYGVDITFEGDTALFLRNARFYFITQSGADSVRVIVDGRDTIDGHVVEMENAEAVHLRTTVDAALFEGWLTMVMRDMPDPPAVMSASVSLMCDDSVYFSGEYEMSTADVSRTIHLSSDVSACGEN